MELGILKRVDAARILVDETILDNDLLLFFTKEDTNLPLRVRNRAESLLSTLGLGTSYII